MTPLTGSDMTGFPTSMLIFGCGNMGSAMLRGWIASGIKASQFTVIDPFAEGLPDGVKLHRNAAEVDGKFDAMLLGIKPQMINELAPQIAPLLNVGAVAISILAGTKAATLGEHFPNARIMRLMPNLAAAIGKSPLALWSNDLDDEAKADAENWLDSLGTPIWLADESQMNAVTALVGSGPAFVYRFIDALAAAGATTGLPADVAATLALSMVEGAAHLAALASETPTELAARVTSPGGTTAAGLAVMDKDAALEKLVEATLTAARDRGAELANLGSKA